MTIKIQIHTHAPTYKYRDTLSPMHLHVLKLSYADLQLHMQIDSQMNIAAQPELETFLRKEWSLLV